VSPRLRSLVLIIALAGALATGATVPSAAAPSAAASSAPKVEPAALQVLQSAATFLKQQQTFAFSADIVFDDVLPPDFKIQHHASAQYTAQRPDKLRVDYTGDRRQASFYIDGKNFTLYDQAANVYGQLAADTDVETTLDKIFSKYDFTVPLADIVSNDPLKNFNSKVQAGWYVGKATVRGFSTHHLVFVQKDLDWQIWVDDGQQPLIREIAITYKNLPGQPEYMATFTDWSFTPVQASVFNFVPPKNAALIEFIAVSSSGNAAIK
jgi:hypothetical protein